MASPLQSCCGFPKIAKVFAVIKPSLTQKESFSLTFCSYQKSFDLQTICPLLYNKVDFIKDFSDNEDMKCCLIHEMLSCIYAHLVLEVGLRALDNSFHIS